MAEVLIASSEIGQAPSVCFVSLYYDDATNRLTRFEMQNLTGHPYTLVVQHQQIQNRRYEEAITPTLTGRNLNINLDTATARWTAEVRGG